MILSYFILEIFSMLGSNNDNVSDKELIINFDKDDVQGDHTLHDDREKRWDDFILLPTLDISPISIMKTC